MNDNWLKTFSRIGPIAILAIASSKPAFAQITPDQTLGNENSVVVPINVQLEHIQGGALRGSNLFHSFQDFNIKEGHSAYFVNPAAIQNIFSRVTGVNPSHILGKLGVLGEANLYLINPNGIIFGDNASLDIKGAFVASTASSFAFPDGSQYSAVNPEIPPVLINNVPIQISLQFEGEPATIVNAGYLQTGGNITLMGGLVVNTGQISAPENTVNLLAVQPETAVQMSDRADILEAIEPTVTSELESDLEALEELSEETGLRVTETGDYEILGTGITVSPETGLTVASGEIEATGGTVRVLGNKVGLVDANIDVSGENGGGTVRIGGNYRGENSLLNAARTWVNEGTNITADALGEGDGGTAIVWSDEATAFYGNISARGGNIAGDGGFVEVSGKENLLFEGIVDVGASQGNTGTLLLDPKDIRIVSSGSANDAQLPNIPFAQNQNSDYTISKMALMNATGDIVLQTTNNIIIEDIGDLTFDPGANFVTFEADADGDGSGDFIMNNIENSLITSGRDLTISGANIIAGNLDTSAMDLSSADARVTGGTLTLTAKNGDIKVGDINTSSTASSLAIAKATGGIVILTANNGDINTGDIKTSAMATDLSIEAIATGGVVKLMARNHIEIGEIDSSSTAVSLYGISTGNGGDIMLISNSGTINATGGNINAGSLNGNGGDITFTANEDITIAEFINTIGTREGGNVKISSQNGSIQGEVFVIGTGEFNDTFFATQYGITLPPLPTQNRTNSDAGDIVLSAVGNIQLTRGILSASGESAGGIIRGTNGKISLNSGNSIILTEFLAGNSSEFGNSNNIELTSQSISLTQANLNISSNRSTQQSGNIIITAPEFFELNQNSTIQAQTTNTSLGGNVIINQTNRLSINNSIIFANANGIVPGGQAGTIIANADLVEISGTSSNGLIPSGLASLSSRQGTSGGVSVNSDRLTLSDGGSINASSANQGQGGNIAINSDSILIDGTSANQLFPSGISADALTEGNSGNITIDGDDLQIQNGGEISTSTFGTGRGGTITINVADIFLNGTSEDGQIKTGIYAQSFDAGNAGDININTEHLRLQDRAKISVSSDPQAEDSGNLIQKANAWIDAGRAIPDSNIDPNFRVARGMGNGDAGNTNISASDKIVMQNQAQIVAETSSGDGGNIDIDTENLLLMRYESKISTTAGTAQAGGNGGNITIDVADGFIVSPPHENNDITANAFEGNGGNVNITAQAIFGLEVRDELTPLSDITASSEFGLDGTVQLNTLGIDPTTGLTNLPEDEADPQVRQGCSTGGANTSSLNIPGRGGSPDNPDDMLMGEIDDGFIPLDELETDGGIKEDEEKSGNARIAETRSLLTSPCQ
ncbi:MAG: filamentous hemagglutinin N-terminal domain-containing protein [Cyanobacteria bacterium P01_E01_bin.42]